MEDNLREGRPIHILLVDDDEVDAELVVRSFQKHAIDHPVTIARNGMEALAVLRGESGDHPLPRPNMILLDLKMPKMNGIEFLTELRRDEYLRDSVVFVLTTSDDNQDKAAAYHQCVAGYILKGKAGADLSGALGLFREYWAVVDLPVGDV